MGNSATDISLIWFRRDLRTHDHACLAKAHELELPVLPIYLFNTALDLESPGVAARAWLSDSLDRLQQTFHEHQLPFLIFEGDPLDILKHLVAVYPVRHLLYHTLCSPEERQLEQAITHLLSEQSIEIHALSGEVLFDPDAVKTQQNKPFQVFTPFSRQCQRIGPPDLSALGDSPLSQLRPTNIHSDELNRFPLCTHIAKHSQRSPHLFHEWRPGESGARDALDRFCAEGLSGYAEQRNFPAKPGTSRLSPHLHFGEITPQRVWHTIQTHCAPPHSHPEQDCHQYLSELLWREFTHAMLYHFPALQTQNFKPQFDHFPWQEDSPGLSAWKNGQTGFPIIDAAMRELLQTGWMHNRMRMVVASFLVKNLMIHWQVGERWFWEHLIDASPANNAFNWQWSAGSGADAAPFFRIFNPVLQSKKFDPQGEYIRRWVPELSQLPDSTLHTPWKASSSICKAIHFIPGTTYPDPIVDLAESRKIALDTLRAVNQPDNFPPLA